MVAEYKCSCGYEWTRKVVGGTDLGRHDCWHPERCPSCDALYFEWLRDNQAGDRDGRTGPS